MWLFSVNVWEGFMFQTAHIIWIIISLVLIVVGVILCRYLRPSINRMLKVCLCIGIVSEVIKFFSVSQIVPFINETFVKPDGTFGYNYSGAYTPILEAEHLPFEMCSLQFFFMAICLIASSEKVKHFLYVMMFATGIGGVIAIPLATLSVYYTDFADYMLSPRVWQFFLYHSMISVLSIYIGLSKETNIVFSDLKTAIIGAFAFDIPTFYLNGILSEKVYVNDQLVGVTHRINFFSSYVNPVGLVLTEKWQWIAYIAIRDVILVGLMTILFVIFCKIIKKKY